MMFYDSIALRDNLNVKQLDTEQELKNITFYNSFGFATFNKLEPSLQKLIKNNCLIKLPDNTNMLILIFLQKLSENLFNFQKDYLAKISNIPRKSSDTSFGEKETKNLLCHIDSHILEILINEPELVDLNDSTLKIDDENALKEAGSVSQSDFFDGLRMIDKLTKRLGNFRIDNILKENILFGSSSKHFNNEDKNKRLSSRIKLKCAHALSHKSPKKIPDGLLDDSILNFILTSKQISNTTPLSEQGIIFMHSLFYTYSDCISTIELLKSKTVQYRLLFNNDYENDEYCSPIHKYEIHEDRIIDISKFIFSYLNQLLKFKFCEAKQLPLDEGILKNLYDLYKQGKINEIKTRQNFFIDLIGNLGENLENKSRKNLLTKKAIWNLVHPNIYDLNSNKKTADHFRKNLQLILSLPKRFDKTNDFWDSRLLSHLLEYEEELQGETVLILLDANQHLFNKAKKKIYADDQMILSVLKHRYTVNDWKKLGEHIERILESNDQILEKNLFPKSIQYPNIDLIIDYVLNMFSNKNFHKIHYLKAICSKHFNSIFEQVKSDPIYIDHERNIFDILNKINRNFPNIDHITEITFANFVYPNLHCIIKSKLDSLLKVFYKFIAENDIYSIEKSKLISSRFLNEYLSDLTIISEDQILNLLKLRKSRESLPTEATPMNYENNKVDDVEDQMTSNKRCQLNLYKKFIVKMPSNLNVDTVKSISQSNKSLDEKLTAIKDFLKFNHFNILILVFFITFYLIVLYLILINIL